MTVPRSISGTVIRFDAAIGLGVIESDDGAPYPFHCVEIADGTRVVAVGARVSFETLAKLGRYEAADISIR